MQYIVKNCPAYLLGMCSARKMIIQKCMDCTNCIIKRVIDEAIIYKDNGRIDLLLNSKCLTDSGKLTKKILQIFEVEEIKEDKQA